MMLQAQGDSRQAGDSPGGAATPFYTPAPASSLRHCRSHSDAGEPGRPDHHHQQQRPQQVPSMLPAR